MVEFGVTACPVGGGLADFDTCDLFELMSEAEGEQAGAAVGIDEVLGTTCGCLVGNISGECGEDEGVVLEKISGQKVESDVLGVGSDGFADGAAWVCFYATICGAEQQGGIFFVGLGIGAGFFADAWEGCIDFLHGNRALGDVHEVMPLACA